MQKEGGGVQNSCREHFNINIHTLSLPSCMPSGERKGGRGGAYYFCLEKPSATSNHKFGWPTPRHVMPKVLVLVLRPKASCDVIVPSIFCSLAMLLYRQRRITSEVHATTLYNRTPEKWFWGANFQCNDSGFDQKSESYRKIILTTPTPHICKTYTPKICHTMGVRMA